MKPKEVFLSHSSADRKPANALARSLREAGLKVWYSKTHLKGAQQWHDEIGQALGRCDWFLLLLTPSSVESKWVRRELTYALEADRYDKRIVPFLLRRCKYQRLSWTLGGIQMIDSTPGLAVGISALLKLWTPPKRTRPRQVDH